MKRKLLFIIAALALALDVPLSANRAILLASTTITTAVTGVTSTPVVFKGGSAQYVAVQAKLTYGSGGTTVKAWVQTSLDGGTTWNDIMNFAFTTATATKQSAVVSTTALAAAVTPGDAALGDNLILSGLIGDRIRVKYTTTGTYAGGTTLKLDMVSAGNGTGT